MSVSALDKIKEIEQRAQDEIKALRAGAVSEVVKKISEAKELLANLQQQYTELTGRDFSGKPVAPTKGKYAEVTDPETLEKLLKQGGGKLNRKGFTDLGYSLKSALKVAKATPQRFAFTQKGPQGDVSLK